jgi:hypothetical protein
MASQPLQALSVNPPVKTAAFTGMTGRSVGSGNNPQRILIAIDPDFDDVQIVSAAFAFLPQAVAAARMEMDRAVCLCGSQRLRVHIANHQHRAVGNIGY